MATAKKLPSGSWRCLSYDYTDNNGKRHYKSFSAKTKKEAEYLAAQYQIDKNNTQPSCKPLIMTVSDATTQYINSKCNVLSPTTLTGYLSIQRNLMVEISDILFSDLDSATIQVWIGNLSVHHKPKTVKNAFGLFSAVADTYYPDMSFKIKLPQQEKKDTYVPTDNDVQKIIEHFRNSDKDMLIATCLAAFGTMRRSELCALSTTDVHGQIITVNKAVVKTSSGEWVTKTTKNISSTRDIVMPQFVIDLLPQTGKLININPSRVSDRWIKTLKKMDIPRFRFHDLRHYSASIMHALGVPDVYIMQRGGWASDSTLKNIYRGSMDDYNKKFTDMTIAHFDNMQHEMQHKNKNP